MNRILLVIFIAMLIAGFFYFDLNQIFSLQYLKDSLADFENFKAQNWLLTASIFLGIYIISTALSLPGAAILTIAAGALFGLIWGVVLVSFASSIGATLAFLVSRYLLQSTVQKRFGKRLDTINRGIEKEGAFYLFTLRLVPVFPFFLINLVMGLTKIKTVTFYWVSQLGMLLGTIVYVNAGTQLGQLQTLSGIASPDILISFTLLGVFPLIAKKILEVIQRRRVYKKWSKPKRFDRNLVVIGAGAGGLVSAYIAATVKAKVTLVEAHKMGGDCLNYGCVPSKALIKSAKVAHHIANAENFGLEPRKAQHSFKRVMARIHEVIKKIEPHDSVERYTNLGVEVLEGYATLKDPWTVSIKLNDGTEQTLTTRSIVLATGAAPYVPPIEGIHNANYVTSDNLWEKFSVLDAAPKRLVILGGGPIGCELAQSFARLGSEVTQIEMADRVMLREDKEVSSYVQERLESEGVSLLLKHKAVRFEQEGDEHFIVTENDKGQTRVVYDELICAVNRAPRLEGYGLESLGIETDRTIVTNDYLQTRFPNIYAVGDAAGPFQFTHTAAHQAWYGAVNALFGLFKKFKADYSVIPWTTFVDPEVARVGLNEQEAKEQGIAYEVSRYGIDDLDRAIAESADYGFIKVLTPPGKDKILGVTIVGEHAGDLLAEFVLAMKHNLGLNKILGTIHTYPTWNEANKYLAGEWKKAHKPEAALRWLERYHAWMRG